jgi:hypothetical protein
MKSIWIYGHNLKDNIHARKIIILLMHTSYPKYIYIYSNFLELNHEEKLIKKYQTCQHPNKLGLLGLS